MNHSWLPSFGVLALSSICACRSSEPTADLERAPASAVHAQAISLEQRQLFLDVHSSGDRLLGSLQDAPENSDATRLLRVRWLSDASPTDGRWMLDAELLEDARFIAGSTQLAVITAKRDLLLLPSRFGAPTLLDRDAHGPLSVSADGRFLAYTKGHSPDYEVVRFDLAKGAADFVSSGFAPCWSPALSKDGSTIVFTSGKEGYPSLYRVQHATVSLLAARPSSFPTGPTAPRLVHQSLLFENEEGIHLLDLPTLRVSRSWPGLHLPVLEPSGDTVLVQTQAGLSWSRLSLASQGGAR